MSEVDLQTRLEALALPKLGRKWRPEGHTKMTPLMRLDKLIVLPYHASHSLRVVTEHGKTHGGGRRVRAGREGRRRRLVVVAVWPRRRATGLGRARATPRGSRAADVAPRAAEEQEEREAGCRDGRRGVAVTRR